MPLPRLQNRIFYKDGKVHLDLTEFEPDQWQGYRRAGALRQLGVNTR